MISWCHGNWHCIGDIYKQVCTDVILLHVIYNCLQYPKSLCKIKTKKNTKKTDLFVDKLGACEQHADHSSLQSSWAWKSFGDQQAFHAYVIEAATFIM